MAPQHAEQMKYFSLWQGFYGCAIMCRLGEH